MLIQTKIIFFLNLVLTYSLLISTKSSGSRSSFSRSSYRSSSFSTSYYTYFNFYTNTYSYRAIGTQDGWWWIIFAILTGFMLLICIFIWSIARCMGVHFCAIFQSLFLCKCSQYKQIDARYKEAIAHNNRQQPQQSEADNDLRVMQQQAASDNGIYQMNSVLGHQPVINQNQNYPNSIQGYPKVDHDPFYSARLQATHDQSILVNQTIIQAPPISYTFNPQPQQLVYQQPVIYQPQEYPIQQPPQFDPNQQQPQLMQNQPMYDPNQQYAAGYPQQQPTGYVPSGYGYPPPQ
ncbi:UNKNOWN [Stylonychia lemnae]|uniref:Uncharacterized protein n=1 Tax=Stylonychia lemnae TaxID=5949 RepID=A0A078A7I5_STYLE|nr:UNKNOWN [Stylonychia lemnae]|eukprot:CDW77512.1 UNKNOWN [Stylonychia lemnae]